MSLAKWIYKDKFIVIFLNIENNEWVFDSVKKIKANTEDITINDKTYPISTKEVIYRKFNVRYYFVNKVDCKQIKREDFNLNKSNNDSEMIDLLTKKHVIKDIVNSGVLGMKDKIVYVIIGLIIGLLTGLFVMNILKQQKIDELYEELRNSQPIIFEMIQSFKILLR